MKPRRRDGLKGIAEQASEWLDVVEDGLKPADRAAFAAWISESPLHVRDFLNATAIDRLLEHIDRDGRIDVDAIRGSIPGNVLSLGERAEERSRSRVRWPWAAAAVAIVTLAAVGVWWLASGSGGWQDYATAVGEQRAFELADGSVVHVNTASRMQVRFSADSRDIRLLDGEALFTVQRDPERPFRVHTRDALIQAVGTRFNIYHRPDRTTVSVIEGSVQVSEHETRRESTRQSVRLAAGEEADIRAGGGIVERVSADAVVVTAWRQRRLIFSGDSLAEIAAQFNRYNRTPKVVIEGDTLRARRYTANFDADDPESLLQVLAKDESVIFEARGDELVVRPRM